MKYNPVICAIDKSDIQEAKNLCKLIKDKVGLIKLGMEFFYNEGLNGVRQFADMNLPIFLDLKLHDIPNTVAKAIKPLVALENVRILTIHSQGGYEMMKAAMKSVKEEAEKLNRKPPLVVGVTILTSIDELSLKKINSSSNIESMIQNLSLEAQAAGLDGVVCSPHEITLIKSVCGKDFKLIVPGIRADNNKNDDQKRTLSAHEAVKKGADYLVIGRPITGSKDPAAAADEILRSL